VTHVVAISWQNVTKWNNYRRGWDACSGLGSPDGASLAGLLTAHAAAVPSVAKKKAATKKKKK